MKNDSSAVDPLLRVGNLDPSVKAMQAARMAAGRFFEAMAEMDGG